MEQVDTPQPLPQHPRWMKPDELSAWVQRCVDCQIPESVVLDYKEHAYRLSKPEAQGELAKDITSFANHQGGALLVGIGEKRHPMRRKLRIPKSNYGIKPKVGFEIQARDILASHVSPMLPDLQILWVPNAGDDSRGVYLIWHPESWLAPHMVHGYGEFRYFWRDAASSRPVPITEQQVDRLYQRRISGERRREAFLSQTDFSLDRSMGQPCISICLCPRLLLAQALPFSDRQFRDWVQSNSFGVRRQHMLWLPKGSGVYSTYELTPAEMRVAQLFENGALSVVQPLRGANVEGETRVFFRHIVHLVYATYEYLARLYSELGRPYLQLHSLARLEYLHSSRLVLDEPLPQRPFYSGPHVLNDTVRVAEILDDTDKAVKPMLDRIYQAFGGTWEVPADAVERMLSE